MNIPDLLQHQGFLKYFKNTSWVFFERIFRMTVNLFVFVWIARYLGPEQFGLLSYSIAFVGLFSVFASLGLDEIIVSKLVQNKIKVSEIIGTSFVLKLLAAFFLLVSMSSILFTLFSDQQTNIFILIITTSLIFQSFNVIDLFFQSKVLSRYVVFANIVTLILSSLIKVSLILIEANLLSFVLVFLLDSIILAIALTYFFIRNSGHSIKKINFKWNVAINLLKESWPLILSGLVISIYMKIDQVMIKHIIDDQSVGLYAAAVKICEVWYFLPIVIASSLFPAILNSKKTDIELYKKRIQGFYVLIFYLAILLVIPITFFSEWIVHTLYGNQYNQAASILLIYVWASIFVFLGVASSKWLIAEGLQIYSAINASIGAMVNVLLNYFLIKKLGVDGAAWSTLISYMISSYICLLLWSKTRINFIYLSKSIFIHKIFYVKKFI